MKKELGTNTNKRVMTKQQKDEIIRIANIIYFRSNVWDKTHWMGKKIGKCPMDLWVYQEWIFKNRPDVIIETGTFVGGSALYFAHMLDLVNHGKIITIDIKEYDGLPRHPRIEYIVGSSVDDETVKKVEKKIGGASNIMVILDSDHHMHHKLREMEIYGRYVSVDNYMIVEDSCFDEYPAWPEYGPGPAAAIGEYLSKYDNFEADKTMEKNLITFVPNGFLKKIY
mgnify:CR=1 FL=1